MGADGSISVQKEGLMSSDSTAIGSGGVSSERSGILSSSAIPAAAEESPNLISSVQILSHGNDGSQPGKPTVYLVRCTGVGSFVWQTSVRYSEVEELKNSLESSGYSVACKFPIKNSAKAKTVGLSHGELEQRKLLLGRWLSSAVSQAGSAPDSGMRGLINATLRAPSEAFSAAFPGGD